MQTGHRRRFADCDPQKMASSEGVLEHVEHLWLLKMNGLLLNIYFDFLSQPDWESQLQNSLSGICGTLVLSESLSVDVLL